MPIEEPREETLQMGYVHEHAVQLVHREEMTFTQLQLYSGACLATP